MTAGSDVDSDGATHFTPSGEFKRENHVKRVEYEQKDPSEVNKRRRPDQAGRQQVVPLSFSMHNHISSISPPLFPD